MPNASSPSLSCVAVLEQIRRACDSDALPYEVYAAVADLLAAAKAPASGYGCLSSTGVHFVSDDRDDCLAESRRDGSLVVELVQRPVRIIALMDGAVRN